LQVTILLYLLGSILNLGLPKAVYAESAKVTQTPGDTASAKDASSNPKKPGNLKSLQTALQSGKPTLAFFYYSVACSCTAARCAIAAIAIDSIPALTGENDSLNFVRIDAYQESEVEMPYNLMIMPAVVYYDKSGKEINRIEWGTSREAIKMLFEHPETKQVPLE
jgi:hypothetical protein